jgi:hypothetical protein
MKSIFLFALISSSLLIASFTNSEKTRISKEISKEEVVYLCNGPSSFKYHRTNTCRGLNNCTTTITKSTLTYALKNNRTACKICY